LKYREPTSEVDAEHDFEPIRARDREHDRRGSAPSARARARELMEPDAPQQTDAWPSLGARKAERLWLIQHLAPFRDRRLIDDVVERIRTGKEATVYVCTTPPGSARERVAAKLYHGLSQRSSSNQQLYQAGRSVLDSAGRPLLARDWRMRKAIEQSSNAGREAAQASWLSHELARLEQMHAAGADVPEPIAHGSHALLMELVVTDDGIAPILANVALEPGEAEPLFERILWNVKLLLSFGWVHGDLSAHNILYRRGEPTLIDFPQVVAAEENPQAFRLFVRDLERVGAYFARFGLRVRARSLAESLWHEHVLAREREP
jgi:RIO kinase 1